MIINTVKEGRNQGRRIHTGCQMASIWGDTEKEPILYFVAGMPACPGPGMKEKLRVHALGIRVYTKMEQIGCFFLQYAKKWPLLLLNRNLIQLFEADQTQSLSAWQ